MPSSSPPRSFVSSRRRRHTRWPRDWSSDVCSSDLCKGAVFTPLNKQLMNDQLRHIVNHAEIEVVVADPRLSEQLGKVLAGADNVRAVVFTVTQNPRHFAHHFGRNVEVYYYESLLDGKSSVYVLPSLDDNNSS